MMFYYSKNGSVLDSRIDAINHPDPHWLYYFDKEFSSVDWTIEPKETLDELYRKRAEQIREKYDYVVLAYSGGIDSSTVLETFYYNNIKIDEILMVGAFSKDANSLSDENHNGEIYQSAIPTLQKFNLPDTKITQFDYTTLFDNVNNFSLIRDYGSDWIHKIGSFYGIHHLFWADVGDHIVRDPDKKTAIIFGLEKPYIQFDPIFKRYYTEFNDFSFKAYGHKNRTEADHIGRVAFFTDGDTTDIIRKQLHILKNYFQLVDPAQRYRLLMNADARTQVIEKLVYNLRNPLLFKSSKAGNNVFSALDKYMVRYKNTELFSVYMDGIKKVPDARLIRMPPKPAGGSMFSGCPPFLTKKYFL